MGSTQCRSVLGSRALPPASTALGRELRAWRDSLVTDLGGPDVVSTQQLALVEKAVTQKLICDSLDGYVLGMGSLVNKRHRTLWPVVKERAAQVSLLQSLLRDLGLERPAHDVDLATALAQLHGGEYGSSHSTPSGSILSLDKISVGRKTLSQTRLRNHPATPAVRRAAEHPATAPELG